MNNEKLCEMCIKEMFKRVGLKYPNKLTKQNDWYLKRSWTKKEQDDFADWMRKLLKKQGFTKIDNEIGMFLLMWGWKVD